HIGLAELAAQAEKRQRVDAVGKGDVALRRAAALAHPEILAIEARQRLGIAAQCRDIADGRFHTRPSPFQGSFAEAGRLGQSYEAAPFLAAALAAMLPAPAIEQDQRAQPADAPEAEMLDAADGGLVGGLAADQRAAIAADRQHRHDMAERLREEAVPAPGPGGAAIGDERHRIGFADELLGADPEMHEALMQQPVGRAEHDEAEIALAHRLAIERPL